MVQRDYTSQSFARRIKARTGRDIIYLDPVTKQRVRNTSSGEPKRVSVKSDQEDPQGFVDRQNSKLYQRNVRKDIRNAKVLLEPGETRRGKTGIWGKKADGSVYLVKDDDTDSLSLQKNFSSVSGGEEFVAPPEPPSRTQQQLFLGDPGTAKAVEEAATSGEYKTVGAIFAAAGNKNPGSGIAGGGFGGGGGGSGRTERFFKGDQFSEETPAALKASSNRGIITGISESGLQGRQAAGLLLATESTGKALKKQGDSIKAQGGLTVGFGSRSRKQGGATQGADFITGFATERIEAPIENIALDAASFGGGYLAGKAGAGAINFAGRRFGTAGFRAAKGSGNVLLGGATIAGLAGTTSYDLGRRSTQLAFLGGGLQRGFAAGKPGIIVESFKSDTPKFGSQVGENFFAGSSAAEGTQGQAIVSVFGKKTSTPVTSNFLISGSRKGTSDFFGTDFQSYGRGQINLARGKPFVFETQTNAKGFLNTKTGQLALKNTETGNIFTSQTTSKNVFLESDVSKVTDAKGVFANFNPKNNKAFSSGDVITRYEEFPFLKNVVRPKSGFGTKTTSSRSGNTFEQYAVKQGVFGEQRIARQDLFSKSLTPPGKAVRDGGLIRGAKDIIGSNKPEKFNFDFAYLEGVKGRRGSASLTRPSFQRGRQQPLERIFPKSDNIRSPNIPSTRGINLNKPGSLTGNLFGAPLNFSSNLGFGAKGFLGSSSGTKSLSSAARSNKPFNTNLPFQGIDTGLSNKQRKDNSLIPALTQSFQPALKQTTRSATVQFPSFDTPAPVFEPPPPPPGGGLFLPIPNLGFSPSSAPLGGLGRGFSDAPNLRALLGAKNLVGSPTSILSGFEDRPVKKRKKRKKKK